MSAYYRLFIASLVLLTLSGCKQPAKDSIIQHRGFVYCGQDTPTTLNPQLTDGGLTAETLSAQIFDRLLLLDPVSHKPLPDLAKSWTVSDDGLVYTFTLRQGVKFQTTTWFTPTRTMNADDVVFSFERVINPDNPFHHISGGRYPWFESLGFADDIESIKALNPHTVQFTLRRPDNSFLSNLATSYAVVYSAEYGKQLLKSGQIGKLDSRPIGTGPFYVDQFIPNDLIRLKHHIGYWQGVAPMEQIVFDISSRGMGNLTKLLSAECDVLASPVASQLPVITDNDNYELLAQAGMNVSFLALNTSIAPLNNLKVREAISYAINKNTLLNSVYYGTATKAKSLLPPTSWAYNNDSKAVNYNPKKAKQLLKQAGYNSDQVLTMWVPLESRPYNPSPQKTAELIQANLKAIGINVIIYHQDNVGRLGVNDMNNYDMMLAGWIADNGDPDNFLRPLLSCNAKHAGLNVANWCNVQFDNLLELASRTNKTQQRVNYYQHAQDILDQQVPIIPLAHGVHFQAHNKTLGGLQMSPFGSRSFSSVYRTE
ncbi:peptide ABC transporter substrate-binding protein SapA [Photobacterium kishitanii]|uniref:Peptide ABC transporter substrate-binding protein SapA n=1 Tax=Photobacterium kishitanii TaxID=318456 RepID=A0AAX0Z161_9GAMM|nr:ABC transporter substrate-binding protein SapA [Photobacterium kishitanii]KJG56925.1 ABC transporter substrate-binding protein [Photobacterium kishitanii]KJG62580.1 ABC transporter substrate-binding protein [Photobacterium kishitanii]KJG66946.1 ABC transporter substrate-binding protein [Photobacterium kishitanii]KJG70830.1 ABC transporter substrate-binding protein [Photobacterium kishitanii]OBU21632.1 ABC transporter substrate-binding protein [Photobacterium kishitanii]